MKVRKALFPVAGVADGRAKACDPLARFSELRPIVDKPIIQFTTRALPDQYARRPSAAGGHAHGRSIGRTDR